MCPALDGVKPLDVLEAGRLYSSAHVVNNPFRYVYALSFDMKEKIAEDDVLASLGGPLGLSNINSNPPNPLQARRTSSLRDCSSPPLAAIKGRPGTHLKGCGEKAVRLPRLSLARPTILSHQVCSCRTRHLQTSTKRPRAI